MKVTIWYHITEKLPLTSGMHLAYKAHSIGDDYSEIGIFYFNQQSKTWRESSHGVWVNVEYWCEIDLNWFETKPNLHLSLAEKNAVDAVIKANQNYELITKLTNG